MHVCCHNIRIWPFIIVHSNERRYVKRVLNLGVHTDADYIYIHIIIFLYITFIAIYIYLKYSGMEGTSIWFRNIDTRTVPVAQWTKWWFLALQVWPNSEELHLCILNIPELQYTHNRYIRITFIEGTSAIWTWARKKFTLRTTKKLEKIFVL